MTVSGYAKIKDINVLSNIPVYPRNISTSFTEFLHSLLKLSVAHVPTNHFISVILVRYWNNLNASTMLHKKHYPSIHTL